MKAVICTKYGSPEVLQIQEVEKPIPKNNQILIKIVATAVNSGDVRVRSLDVNGFLKVIMRLVLGISKPRKPILGTVFSGVVETVGDIVSKFKVGDKVFGMTGFNFGTYAEYIAINQDSNVLGMPRNATFDDA
ncbi:MAG: alcohol dehydrogenase catalytic domain-containing protein, partial [Prolixibacteraceae bacterium]|nr:alcohol dehydrogenase catalytic domain-containing protein [Prolixibacteraceae bacterium]